MTYRSLLLGCFLLLISAPSFCWGFYGHRLINQYAVYLLPPEMLVLYRPQIDYLQTHAVDPDKRRYAVAGEAPRHYIDLDHYGHYPFDSLPREWNAAVAIYSADTLEANGIVPWWTCTMLERLTQAFRERDYSRILRLSTEIGHYIADAHVPLHASSNHNGQLTGQEGIHGFWESRIPELLAEKEWDFFIDKAIYIDRPAGYIWDRVLESAAAADTVLRAEQQLTASFTSGAKYAYEARNGITIRQYSELFSRRYDALLNGMIERRMQAAIRSVASFWYTAWVNAGQPDLSAGSRGLISKTNSDDPGPADSLAKRKIRPLREHEH